MSERDLAFYGGHLLAESIASAADAQLMAAAPDMREALSTAAEALALPTSPESKARALAVVRAAITKADGK